MTSAKWVNNFADRSVPHLLIDLVRRYCVPGVWGCSTDVLTAFPSSMLWTVSAIVLSEAAARYN